jgi:hypothetical protein
LEAEQCLSKGKYDLYNKALIIGENIKAPSLVLKSFRHWYYISAELYDETQQSYAKALEIAEKLSEPKEIAIILDSCRISLEDSIEKSDDLSNQASILANIGELIMRREIT